MLPLTRGLSTNALAARNDRPLRCRAEVTMTRFVGLVACLFAAACSVYHGVSGKQPGAADAADPTPVATVGPLRNVDEERRANEAAYRFLYVPDRKRLAVECSGQWIAIVAGRVVPATGPQIEPFKTMKEADAAAREAAPDAAHRFVFQIGEEGDVDWPIGGSDLRNVVGTRLLLLMQGMTPDEWSKSANPLDALLGGKVRALLSQGAGDARLFVRPEVGPVAAAGVARDFCVATGFAGTAVLPKESAEGLSMWEIPGTARLGDGAEDESRRAYARIRWPASGMDFTVPVAIWPK
jgi:hypothetical protein